MVNNKPKIINIGTSAQPHVRSPTRAKKDSIYSMPIFLIVHDAMIGFIGLIIASKTRICNENGAFVT